MNRYHFLRRKLWLRQVSEQVQNRTFKMLIGKIYFDI